MRIASSDIASITNGVLFGEPDLIVNELLTDSRQINYTEGVAFIAIHGINHDGHNFIDILYKRGLRIFIVNKLPDNSEKYPSSAFIVTDDTLEALQSLAAWKRKNFKRPVIAVTGSAGKTIVKEWLADIAGLSKVVIRSPKSYNSQVGVPLSVWKLDPKYNLGIFEAGISLPGEMERLQKIIDPDIGVITNIGDAHSENFQDVETKAREKLKLFVNSSKIIFCRDHTIIYNLLSSESCFRSKELFDWSLVDEEAKVFVRKKILYGSYTCIELNYNNVTFEFEIPFSDGASVENAITVATVCLALGIDTAVISRGMLNLVSVAMRMELKSGINNCQLIEDYYNSDPGSLNMALEYLKSQNKRKTTLILSDFIESGRNETELCKEVALLIKRTGIERFIGIGRTLSANSSLFEENAKFFYSTDEFVKSFNNKEFGNEIILLKGARAYEFEKIGNLLEQQAHTTVLEINLDAISHNLNEFRRFLSQGTRIMAMVKAFAYGAGSFEIASLLEYHLVSYLAVAYTDEGVELRNAGVSIPIMVMSPNPVSLELMIRYNLEPEIFSFSSLEKFVAVASRHGLINYPVHIKIDTGMHRLGFMPEEIDELAGRLRNSDCIKVISVFSHLAGSDDPSLDSFTHNQADVFVRAASTVQHAVGHTVMRHILNTSGIIRFPQYQFDMVRPGIGIYGIGNYPGVELRTASRFKTRISQVKKIASGEPIGYNCADVSDKDRLIAVLPVGYADGLNRKLGNRNGYLFIKGERVPIIGNICMDMCMADITGSDASEGDEAEIFGENIKIDDIADKCDTIPYEILTSIPGRVKRIYYRE